MWIFTKIGFFSIVQDSKTRGWLVVRGRVKDDIIRFVQSYRASSPLVETPEADYPYRTFIRQEDFQEVIADIANSIDYFNFKSSLPNEVAHVYMDVWATMAEAEEKLTTYRKEFPHDAKAAVENIKTWDDAELEKGTVAKRSWQAQASSSVDNPDLFEDDDRDATVPVKVCRSCGTFYEADSVACPGCHSTDAADAATGEDSALPSDERRTTREEET